MKPRYSYSIPQRGVATLLVTLVLLLLSSLVVFYVARGSVIEQRLSANEVRAKQAFAAASAGLDHALAYFSAGGIDYAENSGAGDGFPDVVMPVTLQGSGQRSYYEFRFCAPTSVPQCAGAHSASPPITACDAPGAFARSPLIVSCGWSDDDQAVFRLVQRGSRAASLPGQITAPVVTKGTTNLLVGGASVLNYHNDLTIWAGGGVPIQSNTGKTFIRDVSTDPAPSESRDYRATGNSPACNNSPGGYVCSTDGKALGHDLVINDTNLSTLPRSGDGLDKGEDAFFEKFMPTYPRDYRDNTATWTVDLANAIPDDKQDSTSLSSLDGKRDAVIWVEGNANGLSGTIGTQDKPVILVVNGNLELSNNLVVNGLIFVRGQLSGNGTPTVYGALVAESAAASGNLKVIYDPKVLSNATQLGQAGRLQGTWRDW